MNLPVQVLIYCYSQKGYAFHMFNFATITVYFNFTDIVFLPIWCENNEICLFGVYRKLVGIKPSIEFKQLKIYFLNKSVKVYTLYNN